MDESPPRAMLRLESSILYRFSVVSSRAATRIHAFCESRYGMSGPAWRVMAHLAELPGVSAKEIGRRAAMDSVSISRALNQLDREKLIDRAVDSGDRRRVVLRLTRKGRAAYDRISALAVAEERALLAALTAGEREVLDDLTRRIWSRSADVERRRRPPSA